ncbi:hypothetical protein E1263_18780 [Kribbella antibiotica]|uniref:Uncharacterized protein n=1 Tax=Kribbella antibiotica TaxID=190195 RepID=A0A4R4ZIM2_9ACTN|nr:hypothetical protein [Kribbella antibiotica]TDD58561.1 hypothetical protein E1263_18780 [Kribbella antibiotica]
MSNDIERMLAAAADDTDQPLHTDIDDILTRGRRSVRNSRITIAATAALTTLAILGGVSVWTKSLSTGTEPAGPTGITITKDGLAIDRETGETAAPPPPVSPVSDAEAISRCAPSDKQELEFGNGRNTWDTAGPIDNRWQVLLKSGDQNLLYAVFMAPDRSVVASCTMESPDQHIRSDRLSTRTLDGAKEPQVVSAQRMIPVPGVTRVLIGTDTGATREALVGRDGYFTLGYAGNHDQGPSFRRIRGYDATGKRVYEWKYVPPTQPASKPIPAGIKIITVPPITPKVVFLKDPQTGKPLMPVPVSPESDDRIRTRCRTIDEANPPGPAQEQRNRDAGLITPSWKVVLKTGTGTDFTALLVAPRKNVVAWCHMYDKTSYDYARSTVPATGNFGIQHHWGQVPAGVAQIIVDLPTGPVRALISNGYFIWGLTGGNDDFKTVRIRGFDANGTKVYDAKHDVDSDLSGR